MAGSTPSATSEEDALWAVHLPPVSLPERRNPDAHLLLWQARGVSDFVVDGAPIVLGSGHALWVPAGIPRSVSVRADSVLLPFGFPAPATVTDLHTVTSFSVDRRLRTLLLALVQSRMSALVPPLDIEAQVLTVLEALAKLPAPPPRPTSASAVRVARRLRTHPEDQRSVDAWAADAHCSARTLERSFRNETGMTLREWRTAQRMTVAARLLLEGATVSAVAHRVGYRNSSAFGRAFRRSLGMTPSQYHAEHRPEP
jgi:AraC-like DNA-binding protein